MTLGLGCVVDEGAVVMVDSARGMYHEDGSMTIEVVEDKLLFVEAGNNRQVRLAAVHSGGSPKTRKAKRLPDDLGDVFTAAENVWRSLTNVRWANYVPLWQQSSTHEALICGGVPWEAVQLLRFGTDLETPCVARPGEVYCIGRLGSGILHPATPPMNLAEALTACVKHATKMMRRDMASRERRPSVAWPLHVALVSPERIDFRVFGDMAYSRALALAMSPTRW